MLNQNQPFDDRAAKQTQFHSKSTEGSALADECIFCVFDFTSILFKKYSEKYAELIPEIFF